MSEHKNGKKNIWTSICFLSWDYVWNHHHAYNGIPVASIAAVFFKKVAIIIATHDQKHYTDT